MTTPVLPSAFQPIVSGYGFTGADGLMRTEVAGGAPRYALEFDRGMQRFNVALLLTRVQFSVWTAFYHRTINLGAVSFEMLLDSGFGKTPHLVNIVPGSYSVSDVNAGTVSVAFTVEAESQAYELDEDAADGLMTMYATAGEEIPGYLLALAQFANVDSAVLDTV